jgi:molybdopterin biosynthesis enzyme
MISVEEALARVLREVGRGISASRRKISLQNCRGFVTAEDIFSTGT